LTLPIHPQSLIRTVFFLLTLIAVPIASPALADEVSPPTPPVVDIPPPPPVPATVDPSEVRYTAARPVYPEQVAAQPVYQYGDPYGFTAWLNGVRAQNGRGPVGHDPNLSSWAATNNGQQQARGMGHHVMGAARRQNSGMGAAQTVWQMWMASPAHQAALLDPTITMIGIAASGSYWTFNAY
jgi:Cysteine-rich secretory protein family